MMTRAPSPLACLQAAHKRYGKVTALNGVDLSIFAGEGLTSAELAARMNLSQGTVRNYLSECIGKLGVSNRIEARRLARQKGWL